MSDNSPKKNMMVLGFIILGLILGTLLYCVANQIMHFNNEATLITALQGGAILFGGFCVWFLVIEQFIKNENKLKYLIYVICYIIFWFLINWHRIH